MRLGKRRQACGGRYTPAARPARVGVGQGGGGGGGVWVGVSRVGVGGGGEGGGEGGNEGGLGAKHCGNIRKGREAERG